MFPMGQLVLTRGVNDRVAENSEFAKHVIASTARHMTGDWGDMAQEDLDRNAEALRDGDRLFSAYTEGGQPKIWIITEADRSSTCVLYPEEY